VIDETNYLHRLEQAAETLGRACAAAEADLIRKNRTLVEFGDFDPFLVVTADGRYVLADMWAAYGNVLAALGAARRDQKEQDLRDRINTAYRDRIAALKPEEMPYRPQMGPTS
jgi:hypothetical protein